ncbi:hypothetical protein [Streptomyces sp. NPDC047315]|uniref:hypothetical protein n=1 Tax=Streptomyces sp. NPDC047315 TaxID=3155142 RepID=UPI0033C8CE45
MRALPHGETITILRPGPASRDAYGNDVAGAPTEIPVEGCAVAPEDATGSGSDELTDARDTVLSGLTVWAPYGTDVRPTDRVRLAGIVYEITGRPASPYRSPFTGSTGPVVISLSRVTG